MKKIIFGFLTINSLIMCDKAKLSDINNTIQQADSLITKTKSDINTLDSIGKSLNIDSLSLPKILKEKEKLENIYKDNKSTIDSLASKINGFKDEIDQEKVQKKFDSLNAILSKTKEELETIESKKSITKETIDHPKTTEKQPTKKEIYPIKKSANIEVNVDKISMSKEILLQQLRQSAANIITENYLTDGEFNTLHITAKVQTSSFDYLVENIANNIGKVRSKNIEITGADAMPNTYAVVEITLYESIKLDHLQTDNISDAKELTFGEKALKAISSGGESLENVIIFLLPFWPILIIASIILYYIQKKKKSKVDTDSSKNNENENQSNINHD